MTSLRASLSATRAQRRPWAARGIVRRVSHDPHTLAALGIVGTVVPMAVIGQRAIPAIVGISLAYVLGQALTAAVLPGLRPSVWQRRTIGFAPYVIALLYVTLATALLREGDTRPSAVLYIPIVVLAAAQGAWQAVLVGTAAIAFYTVPILSSDAGHVTGDIQRAIALGGASVLLSVGTRRSISALTVTVRRLGASLARDRRRSRQVAAVERVGRLLAATGPSADSLERIVDLLRDDLGYDLVSVYLGSETRMRLAAQRGYENVIEEFDRTAGVIGRVMRTREPAFVADASIDPDYLSASPIVRTEICAPMIDGGGLVGIVNIEARAAIELDQSDVETVALVAERMASALALAAERERLAGRADLFRHLTSFAATVNGTLDPARLQQSIVDELASILSAGTVGLTILDRPTGRYVVRAVAGENQAYLGLVVEPGLGMAGRAIRDRALVVDGRYDPTRNPAAIERGVTGEVVAAAAVPLIRDDVVVGALTVVRTDVAQPFAPDELEALPIVAGLVALAITNTFLHAEVTELSVRDSLTGLFNRPYLDASLARLDASRVRRDATEREPAAVALFDLDRFGDVNKRHGHQSGDAVLRAFGEILRGRFREGDLVVRYGGEEFLAVLDGATVEEAASIAEEIRVAFGQLAATGPDGSRITTTVSAGCAGMNADGERFADIVARADVGLIMAKRAGRNRVVSV